MSSVKSSHAVTSFRLERQALDLRFRSVRLAARQWITAAYVRIRLEGADLRDFDSPGADDHVRMFFPEAPPTSVEELRSAPSREYTPLAWDSDDAWLDLEFALHGSASSGAVAAPWAATAEIGAPAGIGGPRGSMRISGRPGAWFLAGDETAVPAMRRFTHLMDADATGRILIETPDAAHELAISAPPGVAVEQVHRGDAPAGSALAARLDSLSDDDFPGRDSDDAVPASDVFGFLAAEQSIVKSGRRLLLDRWGLDPEHTVIKGYWKRGEAEYHAPH